MDVVLSDYWCVKSSGYKDNAPICRSSELEVGGRRLDVHGCLLQLRTFSQYVISESMGRLTLQVKEIAGVLICRSMMSMLN